jgi:type II secretory ATPase GspE/PulE/Tfp pilus assembly ATPase PilB-like protein
VHCKQEVEASEVERKLLGIGLMEGSIKIFHPVGCPACENLGYKGRFSIIEILRINSDMDDLIAHRASAREMLKLAMSQGFKPLAHDACRRVLDGSTSVDEVSRVVDLTDRLRD